MRMSREFYMPKSADLKPVDCAGTDAAVYTYSAVGVPYGIGFHGKAAKPDFHFRFRNEERRAEFIAGFINKRKERAAMMVKRKAERSAPHSLKLGDILCSSWGYDQTNIDFYEVVRVVGQHSVEIRELMQRVVENTGWCQERVEAIPGKFKGEPMLKRVSAGNTIRIASYAHASLWDGKPEHSSSYA